ncbi:Tn3 family transposase [Streptosporangium roseum]|uniref:Tn3 family transposase n=1 Tax=Streptosporangium roseum TaxID=2001 RepID=UPI003326A2EB
MGGASRNRVVERTGSRSWRLPWDACAPARGGRGARRRGSRSARHGAAAPTTPARLNAGGPSVATPWPARSSTGRKANCDRKYKEGQEDQLGALGLMTNVCILWNTIYTARALEQIRAEGKKIATADIARLSPLGFEWLNFLGRYNFSLPAGVREGNFRPLRIPGPGQQ